MTFSDFLEAFKFWKQVEKDPDAALPELGAGGEGTKHFTEADLEAARKEAEEAARKKAEADFAEEKRKARKSAAEKEISDWCDTLVSEGKIIPAWLDLGLKEFCNRLDLEEEIAFSEKEKTTALSWFKSFIEELPKVMDFKEIASRDKDVNAGGAGAKIEALIAEKQKANNDLTYSSAFSEVQLEHPDLAAEYTAEMKQQQEA